MYLFLKTIIENYIQINRSIVETMTTEDITVPYPGILPVYQYGILSNYFKLKTIHISIAKNPLDFKSKK